MAQQGDGFLRGTALVFKILAWIALVLQVIVGLILVIGGGEPVPVGGLDVPARVIGLLNFVAALVYWFVFMCISKAISVLLDIHRHVTHSSPQGS